MQQRNQQLGRETFNSRSEIDDGDDDRQSGWLDRSSQHRMHRSQKLNSKNRRKKKRKKKVPPYAINCFRLFVTTLSFFGYNTFSFTLSVLRDASLHFLFTLVKRASIPSHPTRLPHVLMLLMQNCTSTPSHLILQQFFPSYSSFLFSSFQHAAHFLL